MPKPRTAKKDVASVRPASETSKTKKIEERLTKTLLEAERSQAKQYVMQRTKECEEDLENISQRLLLSKNPDSPRPVRDPPSSFTRDPVPRSRNDEIEFDMELPSPAPRDFSDDEQEDLVPPRFSDEEIEIDRNTAAAKTPWADVVESSPKDWLRQSNLDRDVAAAKVQRAVAVKSPKDWMRQSNLSKQQICDYLQDDAPVSRPVIPLKRFNKLIQSFGHGDEMPFELKKTIQDHTEHEMVNIQTFLTELNLWEDAKPLEIDISEEKLAQENRVLIETIRSLKDENVKLGNELKSIGGIEGLVEFKSLMARQSSELEKSTHRIKQLEDIATKLCQQVGVASPKAVVIPEEPPTAVAAFHERKLVWATRELGRNGVSRLNGWLKRMDKNNTGYLSAKLIAMAMQESGGAELSEREIRHLTSGMKHNRSKEIDYQELIDVMCTMLTTQRRRHSIPEAFDDSMNVSMDEILTSIRAQLIRICPFDQVPRIIRIPFRKRDPDADGIVSAATFTAAVDELGLILLPQEIRSILRRYDPRGDGFVCYSRFISDLLDQKQQTKEDAITDELAEILYQALEQCASCSDGLRSMMKLHMLFREKDRDGDGLLNRREFRSILVEKLGLELSSRDLHQLMECLDTNADGRVSYHEFLEFVVSHAEGKKPKTKSSRLGSGKLFKMACEKLKKMTTKSKLERVLSQYDQDETNLISPRDFQRVAEKLQVELTKPELRAIISQHSVNKDDLIDYPALVKSCFRSNIWSKWKDLNQISNSKKIIRMFEKIDIVRNGYITEREFVKAMSKVTDYPLSKRETKEMMQELDQDHNGTIDYREFATRVFPINDSSSSDEESSDEEEPLPRRQKKEVWSSDSEEEEEEEADQTIWRIIRRHIGEKTTSRELRRTFRTFDIDRNGYVNAKELRYVLKKYGDGKYPLSESQTKYLMKQIDQDKDGKVRYDEFIQYVVGGSNNDKSQRTEKEVLNVIRKHLKLDSDSRSARKKLMDLFKQYDQDGNGTLSAKEIQAVMKKYGPFPLSAKETTDLFAKIDSDRDNKIQYREFLGFLTQNDSSGTSTPLNPVEVLRNHWKSASKKEILSGFKRYDLNGNGYVTKIEFKKVVEKFGKNPFTAQEFDRLIKKLTTQRSSSRIKYESIVADLVQEDTSTSLGHERLIWDAIQERISSSKTKNQDLRKLFAKFHPNAKGFITKRDFIMALECSLKLSPMPPKPQCDKIFNRIDRNNDGKVDFDEFCDFALAPAPKVDRNASSRARTGGGYRYRGGDSELIVPEKFTKLVQKLRQMVVEDEIELFKKDIEVHEFVRVIQRQGHIKDTDLLTDFAEYLAKRGPLDSFKEILVDWSAICEKFNQHSQKHLAKVFQEYDTTATGSVSRQEFRQILRQLVSSLSRFDTNAILQRFAKLPYAKFLRFLSQNLLSPSESIYSLVFNYMKPRDLGTQAIYERFKLFDVEEKGFIDATDLERVVKDEFGVVEAVDLSDLMKRLVGNNSMLRLKRFREIIESDGIDVLNQTVSENQLEKKLRQICLKCSRNNGIEVCERISPALAFSFLDRHDLGCITSKEILSTFKDHDIETNRVQVDELMAKMGARQEEDLRGGVKYVLERHVFSRWAIPLSQPVKELSLKIKQAIVTKSKRGGGRRIKTQDAVAQVAKNYPERVALTELLQILTKFKIRATEHDLLPLLIQLGLEEKKRIPLRTFLYESCALTSEGG